MSLEKYPVFVYADREFSLETIPINSDYEGHVTVSFLIEGRKILQETVSEEEYESLVGSHILEQPRLLGLLVSSEDEEGVRGAVAIMLPVSPDIEEEEREEYLANLPTFEEKVGSVRQEAFDPGKVTLITLGNIFRPVHERKYHRDLATEAADMLNEILFPPVTSKAEVVKAIDDLLKGI